MEDIGGIQRFNNLKNAFLKLKKALDLFDFDSYEHQRDILLIRLQQEDLPDEERWLENMELKREGLIQRFEYSYELFINTLRDLLLDRGVLKEELMGGNSVLKQTLKFGLIDDHDGWRSMVIARNESSHSYNLEMADSLSAKIESTYFPLMKDLFKKLEDESQRA